MRKLKGKGIYKLFILMILVSFVLTLASIIIIYKIVYNEKKMLLKEVCENQQDIIQSIYTETNDENVVLNVLRNQQKITNGLGTTGECTIGYVKNDSIIFLIRSRQDVKSNKLTIPLKSDHAIPMQYALSKNTGFVQGMDYDGSQVLSYVIYIPELKWGLVTKMDISEVRVPFYKAAFIALISSLILILIATVFFRKVSHPIIKKIDESEENYRRLFEYSAIPIWKEDYSEIKKFFDNLRTSDVTDFRTYFETNKNQANHLASLIKVVEINHKSVELFQAENKDDVIKNMLFYFNEESLSIFREELIVLAEGGKQFECEMPIKTLSGDIITLDMHLSVVKGFEETLSNVLVSFIDITERKKKETELNKLNRTLSAHSKSSQEMTHAKGELDYLNDVCKIIINDCGYELVWIGYAEEDEGKTVRPVAFSGFEEGYLETLNLTWADTERGNGPTGTAIRTGKPTMCKNILTDPTFELWRKDALARGYASSIVLPLIMNGKTFGAISIYSKKPDSFTNYEVELLSELANDLAYGITSIKSSIAQKEAQEALRESEEKFSKVFVTSPFAIALSEEKTGILRDVNPAWEKMYCHTRKEAIGRSSSELQMFVDPRDRVKMVEALNNADEINSYEMNFRLKDDKRITTELAGSLIELSGKSYIIAISQDITERKKAAEKLLQTTERLEMAQHAANIGTWDWDVVTGQIEWSTQMFELLGLDPVKNKASFDAWKNIIHPDDVELAGLRIDQALKQRTILNSDYRIVMPDGGIHWINAVGEGRYNSQGQPIRMIGVCVGITERKEADEALRKSEEKFRAIALNTPDHILIQDKALKYVAVINPQLGLTEKDMIGKTDYEVLSKEDAIEITGIKKKVLETGISEYMITPLVALDGTIQYFDGVYIPKHDSNGAIDGIIGYFRNVTERMKAESVLNETKEKLLSILNATQESIYMFDREGKFTISNSTGLKRLNIISEKEIIGRPFSEFITPELAKQRLAKMEEVFKTGNPVEFEDERNGMVFHHNFFPVFKDKEISNIVSYSSNITERKRFEKELKEKNTELEDINATKDKFFKIIAHDMKNPFISLLGASELLYENAHKYSSDKIATLTKILNDSAKSGYEMLLNLLEWSRSQAGSMIFQPEKINLKELIDKNHSNLIESARNKKINLNFDIAEDMQVFADKNMLDTIMRNLINNALKFTSKGGEVTIGAKEENNSILIFVKDNGVGIEKSDLDKLFRTDIKYSQPGTEHEGGTGIGLLLCKEFVEKHDGKIWLESEVGKGSTFYFTLKNIEKK